MTVTDIKPRDETVPEIVMVPLTQLVADDNIREKLGDLSDLVASITQFGIIEPLLVTWIEPPPDWKGEPGYRIAAGHRRFSAAMIAKVGFAPCIVKNWTEAERLAHMLVENLHRADLTPVEEARAFVRTIDAGMTKKALAKLLGVKEPHLTDRIALLSLPSEALKAITAGDLTLTGAKELLRLVEHPKEIVKLLKLGRSMQSHEITSVLSSIERKAKVAKLKDEAEAKGRTVLTTQNAYTQPKGATYLETLGIQGKDATAHARLACHRVVIINNSWDTPKIKPACADPDSHRTADAKVKIPELTAEEKADALARTSRGQGPRSEKDLEREAALAVRGDRHMAFIREIVNRTPKAERVATIIEAFLERLAVDQLCKVFEIDNTEALAALDTVDRQVTQRVNERLLRDFAAKSGDNKIRVAYADLLINARYRAGGYGSDQGLAWLVEQGYTGSDDDVEELETITELGKDKARLAAVMAALSPELVASIEALKKRAKEADFWYYAGQLDEAITESALQNETIDAAIASIVSAMEEITANLDEEAPVPDIVDGPGVDDWEDPEAPPAVVNPDSLKSLKKARRAATEEPGENEEE